jgi:hypothetical protein
VPRESLRTTMDATVRAMGKPHPAVQGLGAPANK